MTAPQMDDFAFEADFHRAAEAWRAEAPMREALLAELAAAEVKAWDALRRYKFQMFGYWAAIWVHLNRISGEGRPNPWRSLVQRARAEGREPMTDVEEVGSLA